MKKLIILTVAFTFTFAALSSAERTKEFEKQFKKQKETYRFSPKVDTMFTVEGEFPLPTGYQWGRIDKMNDYQKYVANLPIWHSSMYAIDWYKEIVFNSDELSRVVHITWNGGQYREIAFPVRILSEYLLYKNKKDKFESYPVNGESINYNKWLKGKPLYNSRMELFFQEEPNKKEDNEKEYFTMVNFALNSLNFKSLITASEPVQTKELMPGDFFLATNSKFKDGVMYFVMHYIVGEDGKKKYVVATGCPKACDFHIPLFNNDKNNPFITIDQIENLAGKFPNYGFYRFKAVK